MRCGGDIPMKQKHAGYTLVELMIALALGLIVVLVAVQMLLSGQKTYTFQNAMLSVQDNANIGLSYIVADLKHTNLNIINRDIQNHKIAGLTVANANYPTAVTTNRRISSSGTGNSLTDKESDVLVIQYRPNAAKQYDCEGNQITNTTEIVVQRYFLRVDENGAKDASGKPYELALACDAGRYGSTSTAITGFNTVAAEGGQIIMPRVDQFKVLVGVEDIDTKQLSYMSLSDFAEIEPPTDTTKKGKRAVSLQIGILSRSLDSAGSNTEEKLSYQLLNTKEIVEKPPAMKAKFIRVPVEQTIALRNGLGDGI